jgi:hypothetical protein
MLPYICHLQKSSDREKRGRQVYPRLTPILRAISGTEVADQSISKSHGRLVSRYCRVYPMGVCRLSPEAPGIQPPTSPSFRCQRGRPSRCSIAISVWRASMRCQITVVVWKECLHSHGMQCRKVPGKIGLAQCKVEQPSRSFALWRRSDRAVLYRFIICAKASKPSHSSCIYAALAIG